MPEFQFKDDDFVITDIDGATMATYVPEGVNGLCSLTEPPEVRAVIAKSIAAYRASGCAEKGPWPPWYVHAAEFIRQQVNDPGVTPTPVESVPFDLVDLEVIEAAVGLLTEKLRGDAAKSKSIYDGRMARRNHDGTIAGWVVQHAVTHLRTHFKQERLARGAEALRARIAAELAKRNLALGTIVTPPTPV